MALPHPLDSPCPFVVKDQWWSCNEGNEGTQPEEGLVVGSPREAIAPNPNTYCIEPEDIYHNFPAIRERFPTARIADFFPTWARTITTESKFLLTRSSP